MPLIEHTYTCFKVEPDLERPPTVRVLLAFTDENYGMPTVEVVGATPGMEQFAKGKKYRLTVEEIP